MDDLKKRVRVLEIWAMVISGIFLLTALTGCCPKVPPPEEPKKSYAAVRFSPQGFRNAPMQGSEAMVIVTIPEGTVFWCPKVEIDWGVPGFTSSHEEDCSPDLLGQAYSYSRRGPLKLIYWQPTVVTVRLSQDTKEVTFKFDLRVVSPEN